MLFVDTDNALGSPRGDVDDGFALTALLKSKERIIGISSVFGNTKEENVARNNRALGEVLGYTGPYFRGAADRFSGSTEASRALASVRKSVRILALGPLTNLAQALREGLAQETEVILVGANYGSKGRWPPFWPFEFNLTLDREAARAVFDSALPLTFVPLDVARRLRMDARDLAGLAGRGAGAEYLRAHAGRWLRRARRWKLRTSVPVWDLAAAGYALGMPGFVTERTTARLAPNGHVAFARGARPVTVVRSLQRNAIWSSFIALLGGAEGQILTVQS